MPRGVAGKVLGDFFCDADNFDTIRKVSNILCKRKEIQDYRDSCGNSILHRFYSRRSKLFQTKDVVRCTKLLLHIGIDPMEKNDNDLSALDMIMNRYVTYVCDAISDNTELTLRHVRMGQAFACACCVHMITKGNNFEPLVKTNTITENIHTSTHPHIPFSLR